MILNDFAANDSAILSFSRCGAYFGKIIFQCLETRPAMAKRAGLIVFYHNRLSGAGVVCYLNRSLMKNCSVSFTFVLLLTGGVLFSSLSYGQEIPIAEMATSQLLRQARDLLEDRKAGEAIPYLEESLVRLGELEDEKAQAARTMALHQLGLCCLDAGEFEKAAAAFQLFIHDYPQHEFANEARFLTLEALAWQKDSEKLQAYVKQLDQNGEFDQLMAFLRKGGDAARHAAVSLLSAYAENADVENWLKFLPFCDEDGRSDIGLNLALMDGGDFALEEGKLLTALRFYREVRVSKELIAAYDKRLAALKEELLKPLPWVPASQREAQAAAHASETNRYARMSAERNHLETKNYDEDLMLRMAQCYDAMGRRWNSYVIYQYHYAAYPESRSAERSHYAAFQCMAAVEELGPAMEEAHTYMELYPEGRYRDAITLGLMQIYLHTEDYQTAEELGLKLQKQVPIHRYIDQVTYLMGTIRFAQYDYEAALALFDECSSKWPDKIYAEASVYWAGMCKLFLGRFDESVAVFEGYLTNSAWNPKAFEEDAAYRLGMARYGRGEYEFCKEYFSGFLTNYPDSELLSEACSMLGDLYGADGEMDRALVYYGRARECAVTVEQDTYAVFQAAQVYDLLKRHEDRIALLQDYLETNGERGEFARAVLEICQSLRAQDENANAFEVCCDAISRYGNVPGKEADRLFSDLLREVTDPLRGGVSPEEIQARLGPVREAALADETQTLLAVRLTALFSGVWKDNAAYADALLAEENLDRFTPFPLRRFAEIAAERGELERVEQAFALFKEKYADSEGALPMANVQIRLMAAAGRHEEALALAEECIKEYADRPAVAQTHILAADALRMLKQYDRAIAMYEGFLKVRAWRGPMTPRALYWIGVCAMEQEKTAEACAWFQRVYVLYGQYPEWTAKAYAASVECLKRLGRQDDVIRTWREMVADPEILKTAEGQRAQAELAALPEETAQ